MAIYKVRIYYHHTDCGGVVYYGTYLELLEEARTEFLAERGVSVKELAQQGTLFVVSRQEIDYKLPACYGDTLNIDTHINRIGRASISFDYEIRNQDRQVVANAKTILVCVDKDFKPKIIPEEVRKLIP